MEFTRRKLLSALSAGGLAPVLRDRPPAAGPDIETAQYARLLANAASLYAGTPVSNRRPETSALLAAIAGRARGHLAAMDGARGNEVFAGLALGSDSAHLETTYRRLYETALATCTPQAACTLYGDRGVQDRVLDALARLYERYFADQDRGYYGNWFHWEIGIPQHATRTLVLLAERAAAYRPGLTRAYVASADAYLRHGKGGDVDLDSRFHTGANLADITANRLLQGALVQDRTRVLKAVVDQGMLFTVVDPYRLVHGVADGFYGDGSFIQHGSVAYTGSYGRALLVRVVEALMVLDGTGLGEDGRVAVAGGWVRDSFAPLFFEGWMVEAVKGRAVARPDGGYADTESVLECVTALSHLVTGPLAAALKGYVKYLSASLPGSGGTAGFVSPLIAARHADVLADPAVTAADLVAPRSSFAFNAMDRTVHRRPGYAFSLSRSSSRVSKYEYMNGENLMPWFQGEGAHHLYLSGQDQSQVYGAGYLTTVSPYGLAGVTAPVEHRDTVPELYGKPYYDNPGHSLGFTADSAAQNMYVYCPRGIGDHSGGAVLGPYGTAAMVQCDDSAFRDRDLLPGGFTVCRNATATKSWYLFDEEIVVLAAGIGDPLGRAVTTTLDARTAPDDARIIVTGALRDGRPWPGAGAAQKLRWLHYSDHARGAAVGYLLLDCPPPTVTLDHVSRSLRTIRTSNRDSPVARNVFSISLHHAAGSAPARAAFALLPNATEDRMRTLGHAAVQVLANSTRLQAVSHHGLGLTGANSFAPGHHRVPGLHIDGAASVLVRRTGSEITVAVSDPTTRRSRVSLLLTGHHLRPVSRDDRIQIHHCSGGTRLDVDTRHAYGHTITAVLRRARSGHPVGRRTDASPAEW
ncbi:polysaccharide lyase family 8 super-sandwich domain-containing protein [Streptomyces sp. NPDC051546]|uniref:polysaccharide lyase family 8 super-sandwich domain-containing protein n=1 Tax=Streptomyces sp. NPDC051546 TaxID=3365655 RepID=UPI0037BDC981